MSGGEEEYPHTSTCIKPSIMHVRSSRSLLLPFCYSDRRGALNILLDLTCLPGVFQAAVYHRLSARKSIRHPQSKLVHLYTQHESISVDTALDHQPPAPP